MLHLIKWNCSKCWVSDLFIRLIFIHKKKIPFDPRGCCLDPPWPASSPPPPPVCRLTHGVCRLTHCACHWTHVVRRLTHRVCRLAHQPKLATDLKKQLCGMNLFRKGGGTFFGVFPWFHLSFISPFHTMETSFEKYFFLTIHELNVNGWMQNGWNSNLAHQALKCWTFLSTIFQKWNNEISYLCPRTKTNVRVCAKHTKVILTWYNKMCHTSLICNSFLFAW